MQRKEWHKFDDSYSSTLLHAHICTFAQWHISVKLNEDLAWNSIWQCMNSPKMVFTNACGQMEVHMYSKKVEALLIKGQATWRTT